MSKTQRLKSGYPIGLWHAAGLLAFLFLVFSFPVAAEEIYQTPESFISEAFSGAPPEPEILWIAGELKEGVADIMGHHYKMLRTRYWKKQGRTAWILEEIGKVRPITAGFVINPQGRIEYIKVLVYRESHGWEVRYPFFTDQFRDLELEDDNKLSDHIDGISGATLSVGALSRLSRLALYLHREAS